MSNQAQELVESNQFLMISKSWCPDCHYAIAIFKKYGVLGKVKILELDKMDPKEALKLEKQFTAIAGRKWVPSLFFNGKFFGTEQTLKESESFDRTKASFSDVGLL